MNKNMMPTDAEETAALYKRSGSVQINSKLVSLLYSLLRDYVQPGDMEKLVRECSDGDVLYTNGWLAKYAEDLANRLK